MHRKSQILNRLYPHATTRSATQWCADHHVDHPAEALPLPLIYLCTLALRQGHAVITGRALPKQHPPHVAATMERLWEMEQRHERYVPLA
jgi:hypothetical protein